ncbi:MAG: hypothetical protein AB1502_01895 [Thermodesulfobacteriota bacterium]
MKITGRTKISAKGGGFGMEEINEKTQYQKEEKKQKQADPLFV